MIESLNFSQRGKVYQVAQPIGCIAGVNDLFVMETPAKRLDEKFSLRNILRPLIPFSH